MEAQWPTLTHAHGSRTLFPFTRNFSCGKNNPFRQVSLSCLAYCHPCAHVEMVESWVSEAGFTMKKKDIEYFKKLLTERLDSLLAEANETVSGMTGEVANFPDPTDRASLEADRNFLLRIRDRERKLIVKIREALQRIDKGTYGICETCGSEVSIKRLKARPVTTQCIDCKTKEEAMEDALGV